MHFKKKNNKKGGAQVIWHLSQLYPEKLEEMIKLYEKQEEDWGFVPAVPPGEESEE